MNNTGQMRLLCMSRYTATDKMRCGKKRKDEKNSYTYICIVSVHNIDWTLHRPASRVTLTLIKERDFRSSQFPSSVFARLVGCRWNTNKHLRASLNKHTSTWSQQLAKTLTTYCFSSGKAKEPGLSEFMLLVYVTFINHSCTSDVPVQLRY